MVVTWVAGNSCVDDDELKEEGRVWDGRLTYLEVLEGSTTASLTDVDPTWEETDTAWS